MKRILVTGGAGFIGSNLCKKLLEDKNNFVYCMDNYQTGRTENIKELVSNENFVFLEQDIRDFDNFDLDIDEIYNAACPASPVAYGMFPLYTADTCYRGIENMLRFATIKEAKILQFSTSEIYGNPLIHPQTEDYFGNVNTLGPRACYDEGKRIAETLCYLFHNQFGTKVKLVRIFNTYGPNMAENDGRVVSNFINQALHSKDITIYGDGSQTRSFCYIDDLVDGLIKLMADDSEELIPVNLGNPGEFTIKELAELILQKVDTSSKIIYKELPQDDPIKRKPDITRAKNNLNWEPKVELSEGLDKTIEYFKGVVSI